MQMIFNVTAKWLISYEASASSGELWKNYDMFTRGLLAFPLNIPGTAFYSCMQVYSPILIYQILTVGTMLRIYLLV